jgi:hypothetical protein
MIIVRRGAQSGGEIAEATEREVADQTSDWPEMPRYGVVKMNRLLFQRPLRLSQHRDSSRRTRLCEHSAEDNAAVGGGGLDGG